MNSDKDAIWMVSPHVRSTHSDDGAVLLDIKGGTCYSLNIVAARTWAVLESAKSGIRLKSIVQLIQPEFDISADELARDISDYLRRLEEVSLIVMNRKTGRGRYV